MPLPAPPNPSETSTPPMVDLLDVVRSLLLALAMILAPRWVPVLWSTMSSLFGIDQVFLQDIVLSVLIKVVSLLGWFSILIMLMRITFKAAFGSARPHQAHMAPAVTLCVHPQPSSDLNADQVRVTAANVPSPNASRIGGTIQDLHTSLTPSVANRDGPSPIQIGNSLIGGFRD